MKQFYCRALRPQPYTLEEIQEKFPLSAKTVEQMTVGAVATDRDGDVWERVADVGASTEFPRDERLERIATAVLAGLAAVPNSSLQLTPDDVRRLDVESAVKYAKALIAELDKQA